MCQAVQWTRFGFLQPPVPEIVPANRGGPCHMLCQIELKPRMTSVRVGSIIISAFVFGHEMTNIYTGGRIQLDIHAYIYVYMMGN